MFSLFRKKKREKLLKGAQEYVASKYQFSVRSEQYTIPQFSRETNFRYSPSQTQTKPVEYKSAEAYNTSKPQFSLKEPPKVKNNLDNYSEKSVSAFMKKLSGSPAILEIEQLDNSIDMSFVDKMLEHISRKQLRDSAVYKAAQVDRRLFSKIVSDRTYKPAKDTCIAFALALQLSLDDVTDLLSRAGYTLSHSSKRDVIIEYFIREQIYNLDDINDVLYRLGQKVLGRF